MMVLVVAAVFAVVTGMVLMAYYALSAEAPAVSRLRRLVPEAAAGTQRTEGAARTGPGVTQRVLVGVGQFGIGRGDRSVTQRLSAAGFRGTNATLVFLGVRTLLSLGPALLLVSYRISRGQPLVASLWIAALVWGAAHVVVNGWLSRRARRRIQRITEGLPDSLDLMVVCLEAGLGLNATIARVGEERAALNDPLGHEFAQVSLELRSGQTREDALRALGDRNGVEDLKALAGLVIQSDRLGASMGKTLRVHADLLRTKRQQRAEEAARKLPIKVLFPLAAFLLPPLFIMVAGPAFLKLGDLVKMITGAH
jgi:tight adherence protein C